MSAQTGQVHELIDELIERVDLWLNERVLIASNTTGARLETYVIAGEPGSGRICMNGPCSHVIGVGEEIVIMGFELTDHLIEPRVILVDEDNRFVRYLNETS